MERREKKSKNTKSHISKIEKNYEQFKIIYEYFHSESMGQTNAEISHLLESPKEDYKYIFFRLYDPVYTDNIPCELLKKGQYLTNDANISVAHASINFDLKDAFYGLTIGGDYQVKIERCTDISNCKYMNTCSAEDSVYYTYAIKVRKEEYENAKAKTLEYFNSKNVKYSVGQNFSVALYCIRKKITLLEMPKLPLPEAYRDFISTIKKTRRAMQQQKEKDHFLCSTFCSYILLSSVPRIAHYLCEKDLDYDYITPSELTMLPGMELLFNGKWIDYQKDAKNFVTCNPEFESYF